MLDSFITKMMPVLFVIYKQLNVTLIGYIIHSKEFSKILFTAQVVRGAIISKIYGAKNCNRPLQLYYCAYSILIPTYPPRDDERALVTARGLQLIESPTDAPLSCTLLFFSTFRARECAFFSVLKKNLKKKYFY